MRLYLAINSICCYLLASKFLEVDGCFGNRRLTRKDCKDFSMPSCSNANAGNRQSIDMSIGLYKSMKNDASLNRGNFVLFPLEISRAISTLIQASDDHISHEKPLQEIICYVNQRSKELSQTLLVPVSYKSHQQKITRMPLSMDRIMFTDQVLVSNENYTKEAYCWYGMQIHTMGSENAKKIARQVNNWANEARENAKYKLKHDMEHVNPLMASPQVSNYQMTQYDKVIVASSISVRLIWKEGLFTEEQTELNIPFYTATHPNVLRLPMMTTTGEFPVTDALKYSAVVLPLEATTFKQGSLIVVLPHNQFSLDMVQEEVLSSESKVISFVKDMENVQRPQKRMHVKLPRINLQVTQEWTIPSHKTFGKLNFDGKGLSGNKIGLYHDTFLVMSEGKGNSTDGASVVLDKVERDFTVNRPFLFFVTYNKDILAFGTIKNPTNSKLDTDPSLQLFNSPKPSILQDRMAINDKDTMETIKSLSDSREVLRRDNMIKKLEDALTELHMFKQRAKQKNQQTINQLT